MFKTWAEPAIVTSSEFCNEKSLTVKVVVEASPVNPCSWSPTPLKFSLLTSTGGV